jgi:3-oxoacyl-[acyl-carrier protein] reductase
MLKNVPEKILKESVKIIPLQRFGKPEEVANVVLFLASEMSSYITGQVLHVNGGQLM